MATNRSFSSFSNMSIPYPMINRSFQSQESQEMEMQADSQQTYFYPSHNQNFLPSYFQGIFHNPEVDIMKQVANNPQKSDNNFQNSSRNENISYTSPVEAKTLAGGPPKYGIGNLSSAVTGDQPSQELLIESIRQEPGDWVTVFGFPPAATSLILSHFSECGSIEEKKTISGSNWIHLKYASKIESRRALSKNGTILNSTLMIGVVPFNSESGHLSSALRMRYLGQQNTDINLQLNGNMPSIPTETQPSLLNKTFEYLFGW